jgi:cytoskeletal protein RodZ
MQSIGERLEEARKRKGISLREASEATKIRSDFLSSIEQNQFDFELPEIYKRGFIKNYANYLELDSQSILTDYSDQVKSNLNNAKKSAGAELFGSLDLKSNSKEEKTNKQHFGKISATPKAGNSSDEKPQDVEIDTAFYLKAGLVVLGVLSLIVIVVGFIASVLSDDDQPEINVANSPNPSVTAKPNQTTPADLPTPAPETISLIASGNVYVLVKQRNDNKELVRKTLSAGETLEFTKDGPVDILFTAGENLVIVNPAGKRLRPKGEGTAKISIP